MAGVDPFGRVYSTVEKNGTLMGNRGVLRNEDAPAIVRQWQHRHWVYCICTGDRIDVAYTKLFFLDEAAALAAGHRPCWTCQRERFLAFKRAWIDGNPEYGIDMESNIHLVDGVLERERKGPNKEKRTYRALLRKLPEGVLVELDDIPGTAWLYRGGTLRPWGTTGYGAPIPADFAAEVAVLTPRSVVNAIRCGFQLR